MFFSRTGCENGSRLPYLQKEGLGQAPVEALVAAHRERRHGNIGDCAIVDLIRPTCAKSIHEKKSAINQSIVRFFSKVSAHWMLVFNVKTADGRVKHVRTAESSKYILSFLLA